MKVGQAIGIVSDINNDDFTAKEKARAIYIVMQRSRFDDVKKDALVNVIKWLFERCFVVRKNDEENSR